MSDQTITLEHIVVLASSLGPSESLDYPGRVEFQTAAVQDGILRLSLYPLPVDDDLDRIDDGPVIDLDIAVADARRLADRILAATETERNGMPDGPASS